MVQVIDPWPLRRAEDDGKGSRLGRKTARPRAGGALARLPAVREAQMAQGATPSAELLLLAMSGPFRSACEGKANDDGARKRGGGAAIFPSFSMLRKAEFIHRFQRMFPPSLVRFFVFIVVYSSIS
jgi:hypothetical protein